MRPDLANSYRIWLTDLDTLPKSVCLDALDLSFHATPLLETLPSNISSRHWDIKTDVPEYLLGIYDVVNIRHFAITTQETELEVVIYKLLRLLSMCYLWFPLFYCTIEMNYLSSSRV